jgi:mono/diheme cytochrome c family protein
MKYFFYLFAALMVTTILVAGFRGQKSGRPPIEVFPDMDRQLKFKSQVPSGFYSDGRADRMLIPGTVPFGVPVDQPYLLTGKIGEFWGDGIPVEVTPALMARGQERYTINCMICHGASGAGNGVVSQYGLAGIASFHVERIRKMPDGHIYNTIVHGKGLMGGYPHITIEDRWAIVAYIRALQRSQNATGSDLPPQLRQESGQVAQAQPEAK